jgi:hypothetical protein
MIGEVRGRDAAGLGNLGKNWLGKVCKIGYRLDCAWIVREFRQGASEKGALSRLWTGLRLDCDWIVAGL